MSKGQSSIEFLGSIILFLLVLVSSLSVISGKIPQFRDDIDQSAQNIEIHRITGNMIENQGRYKATTEGSNWAKNKTTVTNITEFGLASDYHVVKRAKVLNLSTTGQKSLNYSQFRETTNAEYDYFFNFTVFPILETSKSFTRSRPPSDPPITEPSGEYNSAENRVHYGTLTVKGKDFNFLVVAFNGVYNSTYMRPAGSPDPAVNWNFQGSDPKGVGYTYTLNGRNYTIEQIQNRDRRPGTSVIFRRNINSFGLQPDRDERVIKLTRHAVLNSPLMDDHIVRIGVLSW